MNPPLTLTTLTPSTQLVPQVFDSACKRLQIAQAHYTEALNTLVEARCSLEFKRAERIVTGVEGKNVEARDAVLRLKFFDEHAELIGLEVTLNEARGELEQARVTWDCLRYKLRLLEVQQVLGGAA